MQIASRQFADTWVVAPTGRIDHTNAARFEATLEPLLAQITASGGALVLDFSALEYISSVGLRVLMVAARRLGEGQVPLRVAALQSLVAEIFAISRFNQVLTVTPALEDALAQCSAQALAQYRAAGAAPTP